MWRSFGSLEFCKQCLGLLAGVIQGGGLVCLKMLHWKYLTGLFYVLPLINDTHQDGQLTVHQNFFLWQKKLLLFTHCQPRFVTESAICQKFWYLAALYGTERSEHFNGQEYDELVYDDNHVGLTGLFLPYKWLVSCYLFAINNWILYMNIRKTQRASYHFILMFGSSIGQFLKKSQ